MPPDPGTRRAIGCGENTGRPMRLVSWLNTNNQVRGATAKKAHDHNCAGTKIRRIGKFENTT